MDAWEKTKNTGYRIKIWYKNNTAFLFITGLLLFWYNIFLFKEIDLATADIGRYIINGNYFLYGGWHTPCYIHGPCPA